VVETEGGKGGDGGVRFGGGVVMWGGKREGGCGEVWYGLYLRQKREWRKTGKRVWR